MVKRIIAVVVALLLAVPLMANAAWFFNTWVKSGGGSMTTRNKVNQRSADGSLYKSYTSLKPFDVSITADTGYTISSVTINSVNLGAQSSPYTTTVQGPNQQTVYATFAPQIFHLGATISGGTVSPASVNNLAYGYKLTSPVSFRFIPATNYEITGVDNVPTDPYVTHTAYSPGINNPVTVTFAAGYTVTQNVDLVGVAVNRTPSINPIPNQTVNAGLPGVNMTAVVSNVTSPTYSWSYISGPGDTTTYTTGADGKIYTTVTPGPALSLSGANTATASFTAPGMVGDYRFKVTVSSPGQPDLTAPATVTVVASSYSGVKDQCVNCHTANGIGSANLFYNWSTSAHRPNNITCARCHIGADTGGHPGTTDGNICRNCHLGSDGNVPNHPVSIGTNMCTYCHNQHSLFATMPGVPAAHYNNMTSAGYPASYVTSNAHCSNCHVADNALNATVRAQWSQSAHAAGSEKPWMALDFKTMNGCVQCHTTTGFIAYSTGKVTAAWGNSVDKTKELLRCNACHSDLASGAVRSVPPVQPFADDSYRNRDIGRSNLCMDCHSGTNNGKSIKALDFNNAPFVAPHFSAAGGTLHGKAGYDFGQPYAFYSSNTHRAIGLNDQAGTGTSGPCVACHMSAPDKHLYQAVKTDSNGRITAISATVCANCHGSSLDATTLGNSQQSYLDALNVLKAMLADKGYLYTPDAPYFSNTAWGKADIMGAAYNYKMLQSEPGAYAHNSAYAKKLITDSIDVLYNGQVTGSIDSALSDLVWKGSITQASADSVASFLKNSCTSCHPGTSSSTTPMTSNGHAQHLSGGYGPGAYLGGSQSSCQACHIFSTPTHPNGVVNLAAGACSGCHPAGAPAWNSTARLECTSCHAAQASVLPNGVAAPYKGLFGSKGHGQYGISNQCTVCHDPNAPHISGSLGSYQRLKVSGNNLCYSCHNDPAKVGAAYLNMLTHESLPCSACHDVHGNGNLHMIRANIMGSDISYTVSSEGMVDTVNWSGLCQVCHTQTAHYRRGVPEDGHPTSGCLTCHTHNAFGGAFVPERNYSCNSCHGYPPAPRNPAVSFGSESNYVNAAFEDYSGGGGAHLTAVHVSPFAQASEGWANCTICHNGGRSGTTPYHKMVTPLRDNVQNVHIEVDPAYRFGQGFTVYTGAKLVSFPARNVTGSCFNISCHMSPSPRWSSER